MIISDLIRKWFDLEQPPCRSCETLQMQLAIVNREKEQMLQTILSFAKPAIQEAPASINLQDVKPKAITWNVRKHMLEAEDKKTAALMAESRKQEHAASLEKELGLAATASEG